MADYVLAYGEEEDKKGHAQTAAGAYIRSAIYRFTGERLIQPDDPRKEASYRKVLSAFERGIRIQVPGFERIEVPYEEGSLPAYWIPPLEASGKIPAVVFFDGADVSKESTVLWNALALRERGIGCLCVDGPGQGEALRLKKIPSRYDYEVPASAAFDYISSRSEVDPSRGGLMAISMGGYYAPRAAAFEHRYAACLSWGGNIDIYETLVRRRKILESGGSESSAPLWQLPFLMGCADFESAMEKTRDFNLEGVAEKIRMPIIIVNGEDDAIAPIDLAHRLFEACGSEDKEIKVFRTETGGSQHCLIDNLPLASNFVANWWMDRFCN
jgi:dienelactone hydrolase